jgi:hypothetical protein
MCQRAGRKVRAVFVVDVPEGRLREYAADIGNLEKYDRAALGRTDAANRLHEAPRLEDVLQRHLAADEIGSGLDRGFGEEFPLEGDVRGGAVSSRGDETRIVSDAVIAAQLAQQREKLALAAPDLHDLLADDVVAADQLLCELSMEGLERRREALRLLIEVRIDRKLRFPGGVVYEAAVRTESEVDISGLQVFRLLTVGEHQTAVHRHRGNVVKNMAAFAAAIRACPCSHRELLSCLFACSRERQHCRSD